MTSCRALEYKVKYIMEITTRKWTILRVDFLSSKRKKQTDFDAKGNCRWGCTCMIKRARLLYFSNQRTKHKNRKSGETEPPHDPRRTSPTRRRSPTAHSRQATAFAHRGGHQRLRPWCGKHGSNGRVLRWRRRSVAPPAMNPQGGGG